MKVIKCLLIIFLVSFVSCDLLNTEEEKKEPMISVTFDSDLVSAEVCNLGLFPFGNSETIDKISIQNSGNAPLNINEISIYEDSEYKNFSIKNLESEKLSIASNNTKNLIIEYNPLEAGTHSGKIIIVSNAKNRPRFEINIEAKSFDISVPTIIGNKITNEIRPTWTWERPDNISHINYKVNNGSWLVNSVSNYSSFTPDYDLEYGENIFYLQFVFYTGEITPIAEFKTVIDEDYLPEPIITSPNITNKINYTWSWQLPYDATSIRYRINNNQWIYASSPLPVSYNCNLEAGDNTFEIQIENTPGNWSSSYTFTTTLDQTPPRKLEITGNNETFFNKPTWKWNNYDDTEQIRIKINNEDWKIIDKNSTEYTPEVALGPGEYIFYLSAGDSLGNWSESSTFKTIVKQSNPNELQIVGVEFTNEDNIQWTWSLPAGIKKIRYKVNSDQWSETDNINKVSHSISNLTSGKYTFFIEVQNQNGDWFSSKSYTTTVLIPNPNQLTLIGEILTNDNTPTWNWTLPVATKTFRYKINDGLWSESTNLQQLSYTSETLTDGTYTLYLEVKDSNNEAFASSSFETEVDTTPLENPNITGDAETYSNRPTWNWSSVDGVEKTRVKVNDNPWIIVENYPREYKSPMDLNLGENIFYISVSDKAGNWSLPKAFTTTINQINPEDFSLIIPDYTNKNSFYAELTTPNGTEEIQIKINNNEWSSINITSTRVYINSLLEGSNTITIRVKDSNGNWFSERNYTSILDKNPPADPVLTCIRSTNNPRPTFYWTSTEDTYLTKFRVDDDFDWIQLGGDITEYTPDFDLSDRTYVADVILVDRAGNESNMDSAVITIDTTPPPKVVFDNSIISRTNNAKPEWKWVGISSARKYKYRINNNPWIIFSPTYTSDRFYTYTPAENLLDGLQTLEIKSVDYVNNESESTFFTIEVDTKGPEIIITAPERTTNKRPTWEWTIESEAVESYYSFTNSEYLYQWTKLTSPGPYTYTLSYDKRDGPLTLYVKSIDDLRNWSEVVQHTITVDTTPPALCQFTGDTATGDSTPTWTMIPDNETEQLIYRLDNGDWNTINVTNNNTFTPNSPLIHGAHTLDVKTVDSLGNTSEISSHTINVDLVGPEKPYLYGTSSPTISQYPSYQWRTPPSDAAGYKYRFNNGDWVTINHTSGYSYRPDKLEPGSYTYEMLFIDEFGNESEISSLTIEVISEPQVAPESPEVIAISSHYDIDFKKIYNQVKWLDKSEYDDGFIVERKIEPDGDFVSVADFKGTVFKDDSNILELVSYTYRVKSYNEFGESNYSNTKTITPPITSSDFTGSTMTNTDFEYGVQLEWDDKSNIETGYRLERRDPGSDFFTYIANLDSGVLSYFDPNIPEVGNSLYKLTMLSNENENNGDIIFKEGELRNPLNFKVTAIDIRKIKLNWMDISNYETGYRIYRKDMSDNNSLELIATLPANTTTYEDNSVSVYNDFNNITKNYKYKIEAINDTQTPVKSSTGKELLTDDYIIEIREFNSSIDATDTISLNWDITYGTEFDAYVLEVIEDYSNNSSWTTVNINNLDETYSYTSNLEAVIYKYRLRAKKGDIFSKYYYQEVTTTVPAPSNATATVNSGTSITVNWDHSSVPGCKYYIERITSSTYSNDFFDPTYDNEFVDNTAQPGQSYTYKISAYKNNRRSEEITTTTISTPNLPGAPFNSKATISPGSIKFDWDSVHQASSYKVYRYDRNNRLEGEFTTSTNTYTDNTVTPGTNYKYIIRSVNNNGESYPVEINLTSMPDGALKLVENTPWGVTGFTEDNQVIWLYFQAEAGKEYKVYWDEYGNSGDYSADIKVTTFHQSHLDLYYAEINNGYVNPLTISSSLNETVYLKVISTSSGERGNFAIKLVQ